MLRDRGLEKKTGGRTGSWRDEDVGLAMGDRIKSIRGKAPVRCFRGKAETEMVGTHPADGQ